MKYFGEGLSEKHKALNQIIRKAGKIEEAKNLFLNLHAHLHLSQISNSPTNEVDRLISDMKPPEYRIMPTGKDETIAWVFWHIARIEDLTMNFLVAGQPQIFDDLWKERINVSITDTGNALSDDGIMKLSKEINIQELLHYRNEVGKSTRQILRGLSAQDMKRPVSQGDLDTILSVGGVTREDDSLWLLNFWGKKDVAGLLLMPPTRHVMLHLNDCCKWKETIRMKKKFYLS